MLHISRDEQKARLAERLDRPDKYWKYNPGDIDERQLWPDYQEAYQVALTRCSTDAAPWFVVPADRKWYARWAVQQLLLDALERHRPAVAAGGLRRRGREGPPGPQPDGDLCARYAGMPRATRQRQARSRNATGRSASTSASRTRAAGDLAAGQLVAPRTLRQGERVLAPAAVPFERDRQPGAPQRSPSGGPVRLGVAAAERHRVPRDVGIGT